MVSLIAASWPAATVDGALILLKASVRVVLDRSRAVVLVMEGNILILGY